jgi:two-component system, OmpR family, phosphate regulon sensor histidine kinase PhoR
MGQKKLIWQLYPGFLVVTLVALIAVTAYCSHCFRLVYHRQVRETLHQLAAATVEQATDPNGLDRLCKRLSERSGGKTRFTIMAPSGLVWGDSHENPQGMENHTSRPEVQEALQKGSGSSVRFSPTLGQHMMYVALTRREQDTPVGVPNAYKGPRPEGPLRGLGEPLAVVRVASPLTEIDQTLRGIYVNMLWAGLVIAVAAAGLSLWISRRISRPMVAIKHIAERFAAGELNVRVPMPDSVELAALAGSLNQMAVQLSDRIATITEQRNKLDAILSSMAEGVFAVDNRGLIVSVNPAAARLLGLEPARVQGVEQAIPHAELQEFVRQTLAGVQPEEMDISVGPPAAGARSIRLHGASLTDARGRRSGAVIVLNDRTRIRRLEAVRRDFVANVSHELKTPVTSIQGFIEALVDGGVHDPTQVQRYLGIIAKHASRLNSIIDDLLALSHLEEAGSAGAKDISPVRFAHGRVKPVLEAAIDLAGVRADEKRITIDLACEDDLEARINPPLLEQAVMNLLDNAVKYSPEDSRIRVQASRTERESAAATSDVRRRTSQAAEPADPPRPVSKEVSIAVTDEGCGIAPEHRMRIFERFYVVDKSRSRKLGGTGLGLAIVKHITQAHGGQVTVESTPGLGSTFTLHLPA